MSSHRRIFRAGPALLCAIVAGAAGTAAAGPASRSQQGGFTFVEGGVIDFSPRSKARAQSAASLTAVPLNQRIKDADGTEIAASEILTFPWTSDTIGLIVYAEARPSTARILPVFEGPSGARPERSYTTGPTGSFMLPGSDMPVPSGTYRYQIIGSLDAESAEVVLVPRRGGQPSSGTLDVNLFVLEGSGLDTAKLNEALAGGFSQVYNQARIRGGTVTTYRVTGADEFLSVPSDKSAGSPLRQLLTLSSQAANPQAANLFFVEEITGEGDEGGAFGISLGIPGALAIPGTISSGVVVNVSAHDSDGGFDVSNFAQTMAHETGHSFGLFHTSERDGSEHDTISDTPECTGGDELDAAACPDGQNVMFWSGVGFQVSAGQSYVLVRSPVVK